MEDNNSLEITIDDVHRLAKQYKNQKTLNFLSDYYYENPEEVQFFLDKASKILRDVVERFSSVFPYISIKDLKFSIIGSDSPDALDNISNGNVYPINLYVSAGDPATIGLLVHQDGKLEMFEGNDEATPETIKLVNNILYPDSEESFVTVYGQHRVETVEEIKRTGMLPPGLYVSPNINYSRGYWELGVERILFKGVINQNSVSQESSVDWKVIEPTPIKKFKILS